jgi:hypothetical protein
MRTPFSRDLQAALEVGSLGQQFQANHVCPGQNRTQISECADSRINNFGPRPSSDHFSEGRLNLAFIKPELLK